VPLSGQQTIAGLVVRGLVVGLLAGLLAAGFAFTVGEPSVDHAIALEEAAAAHAPVSRAGQKAGLFLALALYGSAVGGLFALAFAVARGRVGPRDDPALAVALAGALFLAVVLVPFLKYPANPPAVGDPATIGARTTSYLVMVLAGLASLAAAVSAARSVRAATPAWGRALAAAAAFLVPVVVAFAVLPGVDEVPADFPASLLWDFRLASLGTQVVLWVALGALFGIVTERSARQPAPA
jgi:hypothetical protein